MLVVDDQDYIGRLLREFLNRMEGFACVGIAADGKVAIEMIAAEQPELVILDLDLPGCGGLEVLQWAAESKTPPRFIVFSGLSNADAVRYALQYGALGFLEKNVQLDEVAAALKSVAAGEVFVGPAMHRSLRNIVQRTLRDPLLGGTDLQVLRLFADDVPVKAIAAEVGLSPSGVYKVVTRVRAKSGFEGDDELRRFAARLGLAHRERN